MKNYIINELYPLNMTYSGDYIKWLIRFKGVIQAKTGIRFDQSPDLPWFSDLRLKAIVNSDNAHTSP